jgi:hypothetical protein
MHIYKIEANGYMVLKTVLTAFHILDTLIITLYNPCTADIIVDEKTEDKNVT